MRWAPLSSGRRGPAARARLCVVRVPAWFPERPRHSRGEPARVPRLLGGLASASRPPEGPRGGARVPNGEGGAQSEGGGRKGVGVSEAAPGVSAPDQSSAPCLWGPSKLCPVPVLVVPAGMGGRV